MDSSSVATFATRHLREPISTYSFRCVGVGLDESVFSRQLAAELGTRHNEVEYGEAQALEILDAVQAMDAPFCDIGIEIGTWLLAKAAGGKVDYLLTGDGGDELWASHPVYAAQKLMAWYDKVPLPNVLRRTLSDTLNRVRDSDQKRGLAVTLKRILPPATTARTRSGPSSSRSRAMPARRTACRYGSTATIGRRRASTSIGCCSPAPSAWRCERRSTTGTWSNTVPGSPRG
jgi:asparagine synthetase B (glutamine-hydrolysing)